jgi:hypothetical protein
MMDVRGAAAFGSGAAGQDSDGIAQWNGQQLQSG